MSDFTEQEFWDTIVEIDVDSLSKWIPTESIQQKTQTQENDLNKYDEVIIYDQIAGVSHEPSIYYVQGLNVIKNVLELDEPNIDGEQNQVNETQKKPYYKTEIYKEKKNKKEHRLEKNKPYNKLKEDNTRCPVCKIKYQSSYSLKEPCQICMPIFTHVTLNIFYNNTIENLCKKLRVSKTTLRKMWYDVIEAYSPVRNNKKVLPRRLPNSVYSNYKHYINIMKNAFNYRPATAWEIEEYLEKATIYDAYKSLENVHIFIKI